ncbi:MAG: hypothetical protein NTW87_01165 [Planctomycetota bacterium]|nr:hypothetical protein [Planctomycetota bacterium]
MMDRCLADLEARLDEAAEERNLDAWRQFLDNRCTDPIFFPPKRRPAPPKVKWPAIAINDALDNVDLMVLREFAGVSALLAGGGSLRLNVRCNYGTGILPTMFGCELFVMPRESETLPTARPLHAHAAVRRIVEAGMPEVRAGLGGKVFDCAARFLEVLRNHPLLARYVTLYHPDMQGPVDAAEVIWGSEMFLAFYDEAGLVREFLDVITQTYTAFMRQWYALVPPRGDTSVHWGLLHKGRLMIRNDSLMNLSPKHYVDFVRPLDQKLFDEFGGGAIHFCGRGSHYIAAMSEVRGLTAINMSQPHLNDMDAIYEHTVRKRIKLLGFDPKTAQAALAAGRLPPGQVQC